MSRKSHCWVLQRRTARTAADFAELAGDGLLLCPQTFDLFVKLGQALGIGDHEPLLHCAHNNNNKTVVSHRPMGAERAKKEEGPTCEAQ